MLVPSLHDFGFETCIRELCGYECFVFLVLCCAVLRLSSGKPPIVLRCATPESRRWCLPYVLYLILFYVRGFLFFFSFTYGLTSGLCGTPALVSAAGLRRDEWVRHAETEAIAHASAREPDRPPSLMETERLSYVRDESFSADNLATHALADLPKMTMPRRRCAPKVDE